jgi:hypothetical protein
MPELIAQSSRVEAAGTKPKLIDEHVGRINTGEERLSGTLEVGAGEAVLACAGEWVRCSTPEGAEYVAVCLPAFSPATVHRDGP